MSPTETLIAIVGTLTRRRQALGLSQRELADRLGKVRETVHRWEGGRSWPSLGDLVAWSAALGCDLVVTGPVTPTQPAEQGEP